MRGLSWTCDRLARPDFRFHGSGWVWRRWDAPATSIWGVPPTSVLARLDATHRQHLIERYFPHASHQIIIFSTDTEVDLENYRLLQPFIARAYHLNYDEKRKMTVGERGYFWAEEQSGGQGDME